MRTSIVSALAFACIAHALPQGPPVQPPSATTDPTGPPTNPPDAGGDGGRWHGPGGRTERFALVLEVEKWEDMNGRSLRPEWDAAKSIYYLTPNLNGESVSQNRRFSFITMGEGASIGNVGFRTDRDSPVQWTGILNNDRGNCQLANSPVIVAEANSSAMWWINDGTWVSSAPGPPTTGPPVTAPTGPGDGSYWRRQVDWREDRRCRGPGGGPGGGRPDNNDPQDKFVICWVQIRDQFSGPRTPPLNRLALHWHNTRMDDIDSKKCWPAKVKMSTWKRDGPGGGPGN